MVILMTILSVIFTVILFKYGMEKVITQLQNGKRTFVLNWPEWIFWSFSPLSVLDVWYYILLSTALIIVPTPLRKIRR